MQVEAETRDMSMDDLSRSLSNSSISVSPHFGWNSDKRLTPSPLFDEPDVPDFVEKHMRLLNTPRAITPEDCPTTSGRPNKRPRMLKKSNATFNLLANVQRPINLQIEIQPPSGALSAPNNPSSPAGSEQESGPPFPLVLEHEKAPDTNCLYPPNLRRKRHASDPLLVPIIQHNVDGIQDNSSCVQPGTSAVDPPIEHSEIERIVTSFASIQRGAPTTNKGVALAERRGIRLKKRFIAPLISSSSRFGGSCPMIKNTESMDFSSIDVDDNPTIGENLRRLSLTAEMGQPMDVVTPFHRDTLLARGPFGHRRESSDQVDTSLGMAICSAPLLQK